MTDDRHNKSNCRGTARPASTALKQENFFKLILTNLVRITYIIKVKTEGQMFFTG